MLLDRVVDRLGGLSGRPSGRPVSDPPKTAQMGPWLARAGNRQILNRDCIEKYTDFDGRRIREFCPSRTRPDLVLFRVLGGTDFRVGFLGVFVSRIRFVEDTSQRMCPKPTSGRFPWNAQPREDESRCLWSPRLLGGLAGGRVRSRNRRGIPKKKSPNRQKGTRSKSTYYM